MQVEVLRVRSVAEALPRGLRYLAEHGQPALSRNGDVVAAPGPVVTVYTQPQECVLTSAVRDANPFFHLAEVCWMLAGRDDAAFLTPYVKNFEKYAELDGSIHGAYGHRWRGALGYDQLGYVVDKLRTDPTTRQAVLQMWDASHSDDLCASVADRPCNTHIYFRMRYGALDMTVCCRSNDVIMGAYGANAVHFSYLHQYVAAASGHLLGEYAQFSNDYHAYVSDLQKLYSRTTHPPADVADLIRTPQKYLLISRIADAVRDARGFMPEPLAVTDPGAFLRDAETLAKWVVELNAEGDADFERYIVNPFFILTVARALEAHAFYRAGDFETAEILARNINSPSWRAACVEWLQRRAKK